MHFVIYPIFRAKNATPIPRPELKDVFKGGLNKPLSVFESTFVSLFCVSNRRVAWQLTEVILPIGSYNSIFIYF